MANRHDLYRPVFQRAASFDDSPEIRHYGVAVDEETGEICCIEAQNGRVTNHIHLPKEIAAQWAEAIADYLPRYRTLFGDRAYYPLLIPSGGEAKKSEG